MQPKTRRNIVQPLTCNRLLYLLFATIVAFLLDKQITSLLCTSAVPNILDLINDAVFGEPGITNGELAPNINACKRLHPRSNLVRTYLWRISPRNDFVETSRPSYIFGFPYWEGRFSRDDPNFPFTCKHARKAFEDADVYVQTLPRGINDNHARHLGVCSRLPENRTVDDILPPSVVANISSLWDKLFNELSPPFFSRLARYTNCLAQNAVAVKKGSSKYVWRDKAPFLIHRMLDYRLKCLFGETPAKLPGAVASDLYVGVNFEELLLTKAWRRSKEIKHVENYEDVCPSWYRNYANEEYTADITRALPHWLGNSVDMPFELFRQQQQCQATDAYVCGELDKSFQIRQCEELVRFRAKGVHEAVLRQTVRYLCKKSPSERAKRIAERFDNMLRFEPEKSFFYAMILSQLPMDNEVDDFPSSSVMEHLRLRGYRVEELYVPQNNTQEKFLYT